ncbi:MAG: hypothetical protein AAFR07_05690 [Pseudomonadota bacterium]
MPSVISVTPVVSGGTYTIPAGAEVLLFSQHLLGANPIGTGVTLGGEAASPLGAPTGVSDSGSGDETGTYGFFMLAADFPTGGGPYTLVGTATGTITDQQFFVTALDSVDAAQLLAGPLVLENVSSGVAFDVASDVVTAAGSLVVVFISRIAAAAPSMSAPNLVLNNSIETAADLDCYVMTGAGDGTPFDVNLASDGNGDWTVVAFAVRDGAGGADVTPPDETGVDTPDASITQVQVSMDLTANEDGDAFMLIQAAGQPAPADGPALVALSVDGTNVIDRVTSAITAGNAVTLTSLITPQSVDIYTTVRDGAGLYDDLESYLNRDFSDSGLQSGVAGITVAERLFAMLTGRAPTT